MLVPFDAPKKDTAKRGICRLRFFIPIPNKFLTFIAYVRACLCYPQNKITWKKDDRKTLKPELPNTYPRSRGYSSIFRFFFHAPLFRQRESLRTKWCCWKKNKKKKRGWQLLKRFNPNGKETRKEAKRTGVALTMRVTTR